MPVTKNAQSVAWFFVWVSFFPILRISLLGVFLHFKFKCYKNDCEKLWPKSLSGTISFLPWAGVLKGKKTDSNKAVVPDICPLPPYHLIFFLGT